MPVRPVLPVPRPYGADLLDSLAPLLADWLPRQRWFAGKGRPVSGFGLVAAAELLPCPADGATAGLLHLLVRARQPGAGAAVVPAAATEPPEARADDAADCYQLLLGVRDVLPPELAPSLIGRPSAGPLRGRTVYEALHDPRLAGVLLERLRVPGRLGTLRFRHGPDEETVIPAGLPARPLAAEQSNSSVVYGSTCILKLFRRVERGINPDLELPLALARLGSDRVPAPTAWFEATACFEAETGAGDASAPLTLGVLQPFLDGCRDGWQLALNALAGRRDFTDEARGLGRATAEVHTGLADALPTAVLGRRELERTAADMAGRLAAAAEA
ncbi:MAG: maltokinase N-terminal cap-like domain-containing protein, partial [Streptomyces sp.]|uniref:maltokinase N-terminal cap-like domain-containing protein n=1 Tax=Streptomyces sp. TaxID=1931 RepID=UPI003D6A3C8A